MPVQTQLQLLANGQPWQYDGFTDNQLDFDADTFFSTDEDEIETANTGVIIDQPWLDISNQDEGNLLTNASRSRLVSQQYQQSIQRARRTQFPQNQLLKHPKGTLPFPVFAPQARS